MTRVACYTFAKEGRKTDVKTNNANANKTTADGQYFMHFLQIVDSIEEIEGPISVQLNDLKYAQREVDRVAGTTPRAWTASSMARAGGQGCGSQRPTR
jgi:hypothetical protein